jgi:hypothetical protein
MAWLHLKHFIVLRRINYNLGCVNNAVSLHQQSELRTRSAVKSEIYNSRDEALEEINVYRQTNFTCTLRSIKL